MCLPVIKCAFERTRLADMVCRVSWEACVGRRQRGKTMARARLVSITSHRGKMLNRIQPSENPLDLV
jgi:hypothetical protein